MDINKVIEILEALASKIKANCNDINFEKNIIADAAKDIIKLDCTEVPYDEGREFYYGKTNYYIKDGFGNSWPIKCPKCDKNGMQVVRPGDAQCRYCG